MKSQCDRIHEAMKRGESVTQLDADRAFRIGAQIFPLRDTNSNNLTGMRVGFLRVIEKTELRLRSSVVWRCECVCGRTDFLAKSTVLKSGRIKSCGCMTKAIISKARTRHAMTDTPTWKSWKSMMDRCYLKAHKSYSDYGGRGITACDEWHVFENFYADMGERPDGTTLGRIKNDQGYSSANCRWETHREQANNRRNSVVLEFRGRAMTVAQWARELGMLYCSLNKRLMKGWSIEKALTTPAKRQKNSVSTFMAESAKCST